MSMQRALSAEMDGSEEQAELRCDSGAAGAADGPFQQTFLKAKGSPEEIYSALMKAKASGRAAYWTVRRARRGVAVIRAKASQHTERHTHIRRYGYKYGIRQYVRLELYGRAHP